MKKDNVSFSPIRVQETDAWYKRKKGKGWRNVIPVRRVGSMVGESRDGTIAYIVWDGNTAKDSISKSFIEPEAKG